MSMEGVRPLVLFATVLLHLAWGERLLAFVASGIGGKCVQMVVAALLGVTLRRSLRRRARCTTPHTAAPTATPTITAPTETSFLIATGDPGSTRFRLYLRAYSAFSPTLSFSAARASALSPSASPPVRPMVALVAAAVLVGVVAIVVAVGIEEPEARRLALGDLRTGTVWNGGRSGHGPGDASLPLGEGPRARNLPGDFRNRL